MNNFSSLIEEQIPRLRRYSLALVREAAQADDLVQDCLERAWQRQRLWTGKGDIRAWLFTILHNLHANATRKAVQSANWVRLEDTEHSVPAVRAVQSDNLEFDLVMAALHRLPPTQRQVILLVGMEQLRYEEVATILDIPLGTVMSRLFRGRERLRGMLSVAAVPGVRKIR